MSLEWHTVALSSTRAAPAWFGWDCLHASTRGRLQSFCHGWEREELTSLVVSGGREKIRNDTFLQRWDLWILEVQEFGVDSHLLASVNFSVGDLAVGKGFDEALHPFQATPFRLSVCLLGDSFLLEQLVILLLGVVASRVSFAGVLDHDGVLT